MNQMQKTDGFVGHEVNLTANLAMQALAKIKNSIAQRGEKTHVTTVPTISVKPKTMVPSEAVMEERYDRMSRKDFSRKNAFQQTFVADGYANFRFSKRAGEVLSPLNKSKFGLTTRSHMRKMSQPFRSEM